MSSLRFHVVLGLIATAHLAVAQTQPQWKNAEWQEATWNARGCTNDARGRWFRDAKFGAFIHFGPYSQLGGYWQGKGPYRPAEQIIGLGQRKAVISAADYRREVAGAFNPTNFNAREWVSAIRRAGQKYVIVTAKHHDGFCMFRTTTTSYNVVEATPFKRDVLQELADECRLQGIEFCPYYSIGDWCAADVQGPGFASYQDYMFAQLKELLTNYGDTRMLWFDNFWYVGDQWKNDPEHAKELYAYIRSLKPNTLVNDRCGQGASSLDGDYATPENQLKGSRQSRYFEVVMTNTKDDNWGWVRTATNYRAPEEIISNLIDCTSKGGNFVLNVGPTATGEFPKEHLAILEATGKWLGVNGEAIYGAEPAPECEISAGEGGKCYATKKDNAVYLHVIKWPADNQPLVVRLNRPGIPKFQFLDFTVLGTVAEVKEVQKEAATIQLKRPPRIDPYATVVKLTFN